MTTVKWYKSNAITAIYSRVLLQIFLPSVVKDALKLKRDTFIILSSNTKAFKLITELIDVIRNLLDCPYLKVRKYHWTWKKMYSLNQR